MCPSVYYFRHNEAAQKSHRPHKLAVRSYSAMDAPVKCITYILVMFFHFPVPHLSRTSIWTHLYTNTTLYLDHLDWYNWSVTKNIYVHTENYCCLIE
jgi:hypothetical protein